MRVEEKANSYPILHKEFLFDLLKFTEFRAYDRAAIKFRGVDADINFNLNDYDEDLKQVNRSAISFFFPSGNLFHY